MQSTDEQLARIGFAMHRDDPCCWRALRLDGPRGTVRAASFGPEPGCSAALLQWRDRLRRDTSRQTSPYRIRCADTID